MLGISIGAGVVICRNAAELKSPAPACEAGMRMQMQKMLVPPKLALRPRRIHCGQWQWQWQLRGRALSGGPDTVEELLERHLESPSDKSKKKKNDDDIDDLSRQRERLTSNRREALCLYRDIIRATRLFMWPNDKGILWRDVLRENARSEFEQARHESDPQIIARLLVGGRHALHKTVDMAVQKQRQIILQQQQQHKHSVKPG